jgi:imidazole glycerol-phosphate synthase subunit HisH
MIAIVDYGVGNVQAIANIYKTLNIAASMATSPQQIRDASKIILPGVGAFDWAMQRLNDSGMRDSLNETAARGVKPVLGICVGMQMLAHKSEEGVLDGLGWIDGEVRKFKFDASQGKTLLPHMGWNDVKPTADGGLFKTLQTGARFYFLHSYYFAPAARSNVMAVTDYFGEFASGVSAGNIFGVQFHPEKSHQWGIQLLKNFAEL